jgi:hypothetical protein
MNLVKAFFVGFFTRISGLVTVISWIAINVFGFLVLSDALDNINHTDYARVSTIMGILLVLFFTNFVMTINN